MTSDHVPNKERCYFYQNVLQVILRNMISKKEYTLQINLKSLVTVTSHNVFQIVKVEISFVIGHCVAVISSSEICWKCLYFPQNFFLWSLLLCNCPEVWTVRLCFSVTCNSPWHPSKDMASIYFNKVHFTL